MADVNETVQELCASALENDDVLAKLVEDLSGASRRARQTASSVLAEVARQDPARLKGSIASIVDALDRPEAQTRWECLDALTELVDVDSRACDKGVNGAEASLFDEESGPARLAAMRFLCRLGMTTEKRSERVWPLLDEAIQCYHGDLEFSEMLTAITLFSTGKLAENVREALAARMAFDAASGRGGLKKRAQQIIDNL